MTDAPSAEALECAKDIREEMMRMVFMGDGELTLPAGHLAVMAQHVQRFGDAAYRRGIEAAAQWHHDRGADCDRDATKQDEYRWKDQYQREAGFHRYCRDLLRAPAPPQEE